MKRGRAVRIGLYGVALALLGWLFSQVDRVQLWTALSRADGWLLALAVVVVLAGCMGTGALRLGVLLSPLMPGRRPPAASLFALYLASSGASQILPSPSAEVIRFMQLNRIHGYPAGLLLAALSAEKVLEGATSGLGLLATAALAPVPPNQIRALAVMGTLFLLVLAVALLAARLLRSRALLAAVGPVVVLPTSRGARLWAWLSGHLRRLGEGLGLLSTGTWAKALGVSLIFDLCNAVTVGLCLAAVGADRPVSVWILLVLISRFSSLVPMSPGHFGVQEAAMVVALRTVGVEGPTALAVALLYRAVHFVPVTLGGLLALRWLRLPLSGHAPAADDRPLDEGGPGDLAGVVQPSTRTG